jgi:hypothetical protein
VALYNTILTLAAERYNAARRYDNGSKDRFAKRGYVTEQIMLQFCSDTEEGLYTEHDEAELRRIAEFVADGNGGMELSEIL